MMRNTYDVIIVGGGVQGLSLAYNLAKRGVKRVAVLEKSYIGSGSSGRNGEMIRSAFGSEEWIRFFDISLKLWETLSIELDFNVMFTRCGYLVLAATLDERAIFTELVDLQKALGLDTRLLGHEAVMDWIPALNPEAATGGIFQSGGGFARHDAVVWAYEKACRRMNIHVRPFTEAKEILVENSTVRGVMTSDGKFVSTTVVNAAGGHAREIAGMAGIQLPTDVYRLEMLATEPLKPFLPGAVSSPHTLSYMHQTTRGEFVGGAEAARIKPLKSLRSTCTAIKDMTAKFVWLFPGLSRVKLMRQWAGIVDMAPDASPILGPVPGVEGFVLDCGWVYGFVGAPAAGSLLADYIVSGVMPPAIQPFQIDRFKKGRLIRDLSLAVPTDGNQRQPAEP
jgi:sarcosine oxidase subunit beta